MDIVSDKECNEKNKYNCQTEESNTIYRQGLHLLGKFVAVLSSPDWRHFLVLPLIKRRQWAGGIQS